jgi:hypothetical protein
MGFPSPQEQAGQVIRDAWRQGVVDLAIPAYDRQDTRIFKWLEQSQYLYPQEIEPAIEIPYTNPKSQRYYEHSYPFEVQSAGLQAWMIELARFPVPIGSVGILKCIDHYLSSIAGIDYSESANWGLPYQDAPQWNTFLYFRLRPYDGIQPIRYERNGGGAQWVPDAPYKELPQVQGLWYPPNAGDNYINAIIPGGYMLRMFFYAPNDNQSPRFRTMGRLRGYIQSSICEESAENARQGW